MGELDRGQYDRDGEVDYVNGALMLIRREAMLATGLWDPVYHVSVEDADWCVRMKRAGFRCWYVHRARLWHMVSPTTGGYTAGQDVSHRALDGDLRAQVRRARPGGRASSSGPRWRSRPRWCASCRGGNTAAVVAKFRGVLAGLRAALPEPPPA